MMDQFIASTRSTNTPTNAAGGEMAKPVITGVPSNDLFGAFRFKNFPNYSGHLFSLRHIPKLFGIFQPRFDLSCVGGAKGSTYWFLPFG